MDECFNQIKLLSIMRYRRKEVEEKVTQLEYDSYRSLAESIIWGGNGTLPQDSFMASHLQETAPRLKVKYVIDANKTVKELWEMRTLLTFNKIRKKTTDMNVLEFSDASFNIESGRKYGTTGVITGIHPKGSQATTNPT